MAHCKKCGKFGETISGWVRHPILVGIRCKNCEYVSQSKEDFDEEGLCRNCEAGKQDAIQGNI